MCLQAPAFCGSIDDLYQYWSCCLRNSQSVFTVSVCGLEIAHCALCRPTSEINSREVILCCVICVSKRSLFLSVLWDWCSVLHFETCKHFESVSPWSYIVRWMRWKIAQDVVLVLWLIQLDPKTQKSSQLVYRLSVGPSCLARHPQHTHVCLFSVWWSIRTRLFSSMTSAW